MRLVSHNFFSKFAISIQRTESTTFFLSRIFRVMQVSRSSFIFILASILWARDLWKLILVGEILQNSKDFDDAREVQSHNVRPQNLNFESVRSPIFAMHNRWIPFASQNMLWNIQSSDFYEVNGRTLLIPSLLYPDILTCTLYKYYVWF